MTTPTHHLSALPTFSPDEAKAHLARAEQGLDQALGIVHGVALAPRAIHSAGILGAGTMGAGIAMNFASAGIRTVLVDTSDAAIQHGMDAIRRNYGAAVAKGKLTPGEMDRGLGLIQATTHETALSDCDLVIEAVFEDLRIKKEVCALLGAICKSGAIIATNTSTLDVDVLAQASSRPNDFVGLHFFSPAHIMKLLEVVRGRLTSPEVLLTVVRLARTIQKLPVVSGVCYGFIGNRMAEPYVREADALLLEGASPMQIDNVAERFGMAMGPCRMLDMAGVDVAAKTVIERGKAGGLPDDPAYRAVALELFASGNFGQKTGTGYYAYEGRQHLPNPALGPLCKSLAMKHGVVCRSHIGDEEIFERLFFPLMNEGMKILDEGIAANAGDVDIVWTAGYGFPKASGGPMLLARQIGHPHIAGRLAHHARTLGNSHGYWSPAESLVSQPH